MAVSPIDSLHLSTCSGPEEKVDPVLSPIAPLPNLLCAARNKVLLVKDKLPSKEPEYRHDVVSTGQSDVYHPLIVKLSQLQSASQNPCIRFVRATALSGLPTPFPRCQDLPADVFGIPTENDMVIAVSHAWPHQAHPDAKGLKQAQMQDLLGTHIAQIDSNGNVFLFFDFLSISQRPFLLGQQARTIFEERQFVEALQLMHHVFFLADAVLHLDLGEEAYEIPNEGFEYHIKPPDLQVANFCKVGDWIMVDSVCQQSLNSPVPWAPFDRIVNINHGCVDSLDTVYALASEADMQASQIKLQRYPFGRPNRTSPELRGWVFLERFMTMVKCAMLDSSHFDDVVLCVSDTIKAQIRDGAERLQRAAQQNRASIADSKCSINADLTLAAVLDTFIQELALKEFSGTSLDARRQGQAVNSIRGEIIGRADSEVVAAIMCDFTQRLKHYWHEEVEHQRQRSGFLLQFCTTVASALKGGESYILTWDCFSENYQEQIINEASRYPWALGLLITLPPCLPLSILAFPFERPDVGWEKQLSFWTYGNPLMMFFCFCVIPVLLPAVTRLPNCNLQVLNFVLWIVLNTSLETVIIFMIARGKAWFPVPLCNLIAVPIGILTLPLLWFCVSRHQREHKQFKKRAIYAWVAFICILGTFGVLFPVFNAILLRVTTSWQAVLALVYLISKVCFEQFGLMLSKRLGADAMPHFVFIGTLAYETHMCLSFADRFHWGIFSELVFFDVLENAFHMWSLLRQKRSLRAEDPGTWARQQYMIAIVMLREFIELFVPAHIYFLITVLRHAQPQLNTVVCITEVEFHRVRHLLLVDVGIELLIASASVAAFWWWGFSPLLVLKGLVSKCLPCFAVSVVGVYMYALALQHSHMGMDLSLGFLWMRSEAQWECGLHWFIPDL